MLLFTIVIVYNSSCPQSSYVRVRVLLIFHYSSLKTRIVVFLGLKVFNCDNSDDFPVVEM